MKYKGEKHTGPDGMSFFSLIAPVEWEERKKQTASRFAGTYRLEHDEIRTVVAALV